MNFTKKVILQVRNQFSPKSDVAAVLADVREQKVPGKLIVSLPGNGGIDAIEFVEKEQVHKGDVPVIVEPEK